MPPLKRSEHIWSTRTYGFTFAWLAGLTLLEIGTVYLGLPHHALVILIVGTALGKALLIGLFFMHLKFENRLVWLLPGIPVLFAIFFILMVFPDIASHLQAPF